MVSKFIQFSLWVVLLAFVGEANVQKRDHLTEQEADVVREAQEIDQRIMVFVKIAERRLLVLQDANAVQKPKEEELWGPFPKGTKLELLTDYKRILEEAEEKLEDAFERSASNPRVPKALAKFKEGILKHLPQMRALAEKLTDAKEKRALAEAIEEAETVTKGSMKN